MIMDALERLQDVDNVFREYLDDENVTIDYNQPYNDYNHELRVRIEPFEMSISFFPPREGKPTVLATHMFVWCEGDHPHPFMISRKHALDIFPHLAVTRGDAHVLRLDDEYSWPDRMIELARTVLSNRDKFLSMCFASCPYNIKDNTHKFRDWKTTATLEIVSEPNVQLVQGLKGGETPGGRYTGGNGSFVTFGRCQYQLRCTLAKLSVEKPVRGHSIYFDIDVYIRAMMARMGWKKLRYELLNSRLPKDVEVITTEMNADAESRMFYPCGYEGNWLKLLDAAFKDI